MNGYVLAGYAIPGVVLALYTMRILRRGRALRRSLGGRPLP